MSPMCQHQDTPKDKLTIENCKTIEEKWESSNKQYLGVKKKKRKDWFEKNNTKITVLLNKKHQAFKRVLPSEFAEEYKILRNKAQKYLRI